eukprot:259810-Chlamydomonas_euryale.AAC.6
MGAALDGSMRRWMKGYVGGWMCFQVSLVWASMRPDLMERCNVGLCARALACCACRCARALLAALARLQTPARPSEVLLAALVRAQTLRDVFTPALRLLTLDGTHASGPLPAWVRSMARPTTHGNSTDGCCSPANPAFSICRQARAHMRASEQTGLPATLRVHAWGKARPTMFPRHRMPHNCIPHPCSPHKMETAHAESSIRGRTDQALACMQGNAWLWAWVAV